MLLQWNIALSKDALSRPEGGLRQLQLLETSQIQGEVLSHRFTRTIRLWVIPPDSAYYASSDSASIAK